MYPNASPGNWHDTCLYIPIRWVVDFALLLSEDFKIAADVPTLTQDRTTVRVYVVLTKSNPAVRRWLRFLETKQHRTYREIRAELVRLDSLTNELSAALTNLELNWKIYSRHGEPSSGPMFQEFYQVVRALKTRRDQLQKLILKKNGIQLRRAARLNSRPIRVSPPGNMVSHANAFYNIEPNHIENFVQMVLAAIATEIQEIKVTNATTTTHRSQGETLGIPASRKVSWA